MSSNDEQMQNGRPSALSARAQSVMRSVVQQYMETGSTVSSRFISKLPDFQLSSASIRSVMLDLEEAGLLYAPHTSAGRLPTEAGLRLFVEGLLEQNNLSDGDRADISLRDEFNSWLFQEDLGFVINTRTGEALFGRLEIGPNRKLTGIDSVMDDAAALGLDLKKVREMVTA